MAKDGYAGHAEVHTKKQYTAQRKGSKRLDAICFFNPKETLLLPELEARLDLHRAWRPLENQIAGLKIFRKSLAQLAWLSFPDREISVLVSLTCHQTLGDVGGA
jgi:hypothetical protein